jgi:hypothetical protein
MNAMPTQPPATRPDYRLALITALLLPSGHALLAEDTEAEPVPEDYRNWIELGVGGTLIDGNRGAFQQRSGLPRGAFGGVESFHFEQEVPNDGLLKVDGRGIFDNHDYSIRLELDYPYQYFFRIGYSEFRTWYDGSGGFFRPSDTWFPPPTDALHLDRSELRVEAGLRTPDLPELTVRYSLHTREGAKDATAWGDTTQTGGLGTRNIVPAFRDIDETRHQFALDARHTLGSTALGLGFRYEIQEQDNSLNLRRNPGEANDRRATQNDSFDADLFHVHATSQSPLRENLLFTTGYAYTDLDSDFTGYRIYGTTYDPDFANRLPDFNSFEALTGSSRLSQHVVNLNLLYRPWEPVAVIPSARIEKQDITSHSHWSQPAQPFSPNLQEASADRGLLNVSEALELRYTGLTNWVFSTRGYWLQGRGDLDESWENRGTGANVLTRSTDDERFVQKYTAGIRWYPLRRFNLGAGYSYKLRDNNYDHPTDSTSNDPASGNRYPAFLLAQRFHTHEANFKSTWRPRHNVTLVARYAYQVSEIQTRPDNLDRLTTADITSHITGASVSWIPLARIYLQGNLNYVFDRTDTPAAALSNAVLDARNDYWTTSLVVGLAVDNKTDLTGSYFFYRADNYVDNSTAGLPFDSGAEEHGLQATLSRQLSARIRCSLRYAYFTSNDSLYGGRRDYDAHLVHSTLQYRF